MLPPVSHDDSSRFDFCEGVRAYNYQHIVAPLVADYPRRSARAGRAGSLTNDEVAALYTSDPDYLFACALQRTMQQEAWATAIDSVDRGADDALAALKATEHEEKYGRLELAAETGLPEWYTRHTSEGRDDIHLVPGGYWRHELVGPVYERGGAVYRLAWRGGYGGRPDSLAAFLHTAPPGEYRKVLDLGCSFGALTRAARSVFGAAEVVGIDISAPALAYAHYLAETSQQRITYAQRDATATGYEDESFDLVCAFLLLHEVPDDVRAQIVAEAFRILRPGGQLMFLDIPPYRVLSPVQAFFESFDGRGNGENFWESYLASDFPALLRETGFVDVQEHSLEFDDPGYWGSSALWRTGTFDPVHRWVTRAVKPSAGKE
jgi:SAM-dependent methyltransferase